MGCGLMVGVLVLHPERSGLNNSPSKARVVYEILLITITWCGVDEPTLKILFFIQQKKKMCYAYNIFITFSQQIISG